MSSHDNGHRYLPLRKPVRMAMVIDFHAHYYPRALVDELGAMGSRAAALVRGAPAAGLSLDERFQLLDRNGIDLQVLSVGILLPDFVERTSAVHGARLANDIYAALCHDHPKRFAAFGALPLPHADSAVDELRRCLDELGMLGVTLGCSVAGRPLDDPDFAPLFAELDQREAVLLLHPVGGGTGPFTTDLGLPFMIGAVFEDTIAALRLVLSGMTVRYPRIRVIVPHLGGTLPFLLERLELYVEGERRKGTIPFAGPVRDQLRRFWYDTVNLHPAALRCAIDSLGADRLVLGTDFPFMAGESFRSCVTYLADAPKAIRDGNGRVLLRSAEPAEPAEPPLARGSVR
jgi:6-methylsalicylate decarboxylase